MPRPASPFIALLLAALLIPTTTARVSESSPVASPNLAPAHREVTFASDGMTIHGSLMVPAVTDQGPGALIISGSGPTDRNGNSGSLTTMNTNLNLAATLASQGITSLRYDKLGSGATGLAGIADPAAITASIFLQEASDAADFLASQPEVDPTQIILVGHSEGALFALKLAEQMTAMGTPPAALMLVAPLSIRYLDLLNEQLTSQFDQAVAGQLMTLDDAEALSTELAAIIESLRSTGELPETVTSPVLQAIFNPVNVAFLVEADSWEPSAIAAALPTTLPVLVLLGEKDAQVQVHQVEQLMAGFAEAGNEAASLVLLPEANHLLRDVPGEPNPALDYVDPSLPFSPAAVQAITEFLAIHHLIRS